MIERIFEKSQLKFVKLDNMLMGFVPVIDTIEAIFIMKKMIKIFGVPGRKLYMKFVDLEIVLIKSRIWWALRRKEVERKIKATKEVYMNNNASVTVECVRRKG